MKNGTQANQAGALADAQALRRCVDEVITETRVIDMHTHLFAPQFGKLGLWGIDDLLNYHYLIAELFRSSTVTPERFWALTKADQADLIWKELFVRNTPLSEATRGVVAVLTALGLDAQAPDLSEARAFYQAQRVDNYLNRVLELARVDEIVMTNDPFDEEEANLWKRSLAVDTRFHAALRLDPLLNDWSRALPKIIAQGYDHVRADLENETVADLRRFLDEWIARMRPVYLAVSLPDTFTYPERSLRHRLITEVVLPTCREHKLPFTMMIGVRRSVNPALRGAGDGMGRADVSAVERLCRDYPDNRFLITMLSRENQHELCVTARKFSNVMPFGCWWFVNNPSIVSEITRERVEMLGTSFIPQHSDARVLDQLIYKWRHARGLIAEVLCDSYHRLLDDGRPVTRPEIERDAARLFSGNFREWVGQLG